MKKRIALVVNTLSGGGAEKTVANLSRGLSDCFNVDIVVNDDEHLDYPYKGHLISLKMPADQERMKAVYQTKLLLRRTSVLRYLKKKKRYAAVISFSEMSNAANVLSGNRYGKVIISVRNSILRSKDSTLRHKLISPVLMPWCYRNADMIVSCSKGIAGELAERYKLKKEHIRVIYNGLELPLIRKKAEETIPDYEKELWKGKKLIVTVGRMTRQKGQRHLLSTVRILADRGIPVHLLILGEGEMRDFLKKEAERLGIGNMVSFPGYVLNPYKYISRADVVVMPSLYEGFSNVIIEALACGVPVVSTDHDTGAREILAPDTDYRIKVNDRIEKAAYGILVPVFGNDYISEDADKKEAVMAEAITLIFKDREMEQYYRNAALRRAEQLDIKTICDQWIALIDE